MTISEDSLHESSTSGRKGTAIVKQNEKVYVYAKERPRMPAMKRKHLPGTTRGDTIGVVPAVADESKWKLPLKRKRVLYDKYWVPVGGPGDGCSSDDTSSEEEREEPAPAKVQHL